jgi:hypothetical protein
VHQVSLPEANPRPNNPKVRPHPFWDDREVLRSMRGRLIQPSTCGGHRIGPALAAPGQAASATRHVDRDPARFRAFESSSSLASTGSAELSAVIAGTRLGSLTRTTRRP